MKFLCFLKKKKPLKKGKSKMIDFEMLRALFLSNKFSKSEFIITEEFFNKETECEIIKRAAVKILMDLCYSAAAEKLEFKIFGNVGTLECRGSLYIFNEDDILNIYEFIKGNIKK
jgi:hypothetical protein